MDIRIITDPISRDELRALASKWYGTLLKGVVDIDRETVALGGEWHIDASEILVRDGSRADNVWGFNILVNEPVTTAFEYHSLINLKPAKNHRAMEISDPELRKKIFSIVSKKIIW